MITFQTDTTRREPARARSWTGAVYAAAAAAVLAAGVSLPAQAEAHGPRGAGMGGGFGSPMMFAGSPEQVARGVDRLLDVVKATDAQRTQVKQIAQQASADLQSQRGSERSLRQRSLEIFSAPTVDAAAAESVRQQMHNQRDESSRRVLQAMLDISRVLTPEQRAALADRARQHEARMRERSQQRAPAGRAGQ